MKGASDHIILCLTLSIDSMPRCPPSLVSLSLSLFLVAGSASRRWREHGALLHASNLSLSLSLACFTREGSRFACYIQFVLTNGQTGARERERESTHPVSLSLPHNTRSSFHDSLILLHTIGSYCFLRIPFMNM